MSTLTDIDAAVRADAEKLRDAIRIYRRALQVIASCELTGVDFGDYVQAVCEDALAGNWPECWKCGTAVHDGPCVAEAAE